MIRSFLAVFPIWLLLCPFWPTASADLAINGPTEVDVGQEVELALSGVTLDELLAAREAGNLDLTVWPAEGVDVDPQYDWLLDRLGIEFEATRPAKYLIKLHLVRDGPLEVAEAVVVVSGEPQPGPSPDPPVPPVPPDPPEPGKRFVLVIYETGLTGRMGATQAAVMYGLRLYLETKGHEWRFVDQDLKDSQTGQTPEWLRPYLTLIRERRLDVPVLIVTAPESESIVRSQVAAELLPDTAVAAIQIVKSHGG
jgi:hypothetical protein